MTELPPAGDSLDISALHAALTSRTVLRETLRSLFRRDFMLWNALFTVSVRMRFGGSPNAPGIPGFIERVEAECDREGVRLTRTQAGIIIRSHLGVADIGDFDPASIDVLEALQLLLAVLLRDWQPAGEELDELLRRTVDLRSRALTYLPEAAVPGELMNEVMDDLASGTPSPEHEAVLEAEFGPEGSLSAFAGSDSFPEQFGHYRKQMMERTLERGAQLRDRGDVAGAIAAYQEVAACGDPQLVPHAAFELGRLQAPTGETGPADPDADPGEEDGSRR